MLSLKEKDLKLVHERHCCMPVQRFWLHLACKLPSMVDLQPIPSMDLIYPDGDEDHLRLPASPKIDSSTSAAKRAKHSYTMTQLHDLHKR